MLITLYVEKCLQMNVYKTVEKIIFTAAIKNVDKKVKNDLKNSDSSCQSTSAPDFSIKVFLLQICFCHICLLDSSSVNAE